MQTRASGIDLPIGDRCAICGGEGWRWDVPAVTAPPQSVSWQECRSCNHTGLASWHNRTPTRARPTMPPACENLSDAADLLAARVKADPAFVRLKPNAVTELSIMCRPDNWQRVGIDFHFPRFRVLRLRPIALEIHISAFERRQLMPNGHETISWEASAGEISDLSYAVYERTIKPHFDPA